MMSKQKLTNKLINLTWTDVYREVNRIVSVVRTELSSHHYVAVLGVRNGGVIPAFLTFQVLATSIENLKFGIISVDCRESLEPYRGKYVLIIDDIYDTGATYREISQMAEELKVKADQFHLVSKDDYTNPKKTWVTFPWESAEDSVGGMRQAIVALLRGMGEDPKREGLKDTPRRVEHMWKELTAGYECDPEKILSTSFSKESYDEMIVVKDIKFFSTCEHHMLPFYGVAHFAYIPDKQVIGLSKIHRLVEMFARRLQIQERMTIEIGKTFERIVKPKGVAVVVEGLHLCTMVRGVKKENSKMITSYLGGVFKTELATRQEFLSMIKES